MSMDSLSKDRLNQILTKDVSELSSDDRGFLRARRDYLTQEEAHKYESVLESSVSVSDESESGSVVKLDRTALLAEAKELGIKGASKMKTEQVKAMVDNARFEAEAAAEAEAERKAAEEADAKAKADAEAAEAEAKKEGHKGNFSESSQSAAQE